eukprot:7379485-Prymnesium_polylepis.1
MIQRLGRRVTAAPVCYATALPAPPPRRYSVDTAPETETLCAGVTRHATRDVCCTDAKAGTESESARTTSEHGPRRQMQLASPRNAGLRPHWEATFLLLLPTQPTPAIE